VLYGSAEPGLDFLHIEILDNEEQDNFSKNVGTVYIEAGEIRKEELSREFTVIYKTTWPWQIRQLDDWSFLVKFHLPVEDVAGYPCFGLVKEGVTVNVEVWDGELESQGEKKEVWLQLRGLKPRWCKWGILSQFTSGLGILMDVDWDGLALNLCEVVRIKIQCRDPLHIPPSSLFEVKGKYYPISIKVESGENSIDGADNPRDDPSDGKEDDGQSKTDKMNTENNSSKGEPPNASSEKGSKSGGSTNVSHKKTCDVVDADPDSSSSTSIPERMTSARKNLLEWLGAENPDEERCFNLLRDMELVDEDGFYMYEGEDTGKQMEVTEDHLPIGAEASQPEFAEEQNKAADNMKKKQYWGPIAGTR
jgi:hypothetical protein